MTCRENLEVMKGAGLKMTLGSLYRWIGKYIEEPTPAAFNFEPSAFTAPPDFCNWVPNVADSGFTISEWDMPEARETANGNPWSAKEDIPSFNNWLPQFNLY